ncbi:alpha/beta hydrolase-fold protein [Labilibaculum sp.]|uniref:alpha/beta hydrolase-fold protein n=1 Tax=Labilibaculum sp. TaxID=2060723 RepID=UPI00356A7B16
MIRYLFSTLFALFLFSTSHAEVNVKNLRNSRVYSKVLKEYREMRVLLPNEYDNTYYKYPTIYLLDAETNFDMGIEVLSFLMDNHFIPPHIVVGLPNTDRFRDMTPVDTVMNKNIYRTRGGADQFIKALEVDIFPFLNENFRMNSQRLLIGHSYSGLFVSYAFYFRTDLFDKYMAFSPILWWNNKAIVHDIDTFLENNSSIRKQLFISFAKEASEMLKSCKSLISSLKINAPSDLKWKYEWMPDESHYSLYRKSLMKGMEFMFLDYKYPDVQVLVDEGAGVAQSYQKNILLTYGRNEKLPYSLLESVCLQLKEAKRYDEAMNFLKFTVSSYPNRAESFFYVGEIYENSNQLTEALKFYKIAHEKDTDRWEYENKCLEMQKLLTDIEKNTQTLTNLE